MNSNLRVGHCLIVTRFSADQPGYLDFAYRVEALAKNYRISLISDHGLDVPEMQIATVKHVVLPGGKGTFGLFRYLWCVARYIKHVQPDCVLLLHTMTAPLVYLLGNIPHVLYWNEHANRVLGSDRVGSSLKRTYRRFKLRYLFIEATKRADLVMPIGEAHLDDLLRLGCKPERLKLIPMGVDKRFAGVALRRCEPDIGDPLELIYTGSVQRERGRDVMIEGVAKAAATGLSVRLTIVGARPDEIEHCRMYARQLGIAGRIVVHGRVPGMEIPHFIAKADAGVCLWEDMPWWRFNPPTKLFEYLVAGLPVLVSNIRTHTDYIDHGENGLIFEYDSDSFAKVIREFWSRRADWAKMKRCAFESGQPYLWGNVEPLFLDAVASVMS